MTRNEKTREENRYDILIDVLRHSLLGFEFLSGQKGELETTEPSRFVAEHHAHHIRRHFALLDIPEKRSEPC